MKDTEWIHEVVEAFYTKAKDDVLIGYHFRIIEDFEEHIPRIASFWEWQLLGSTQRQVIPPFDLMKVHIPLGIKRGELGRWLVLFKKTLDEKIQDYPESEELRKKWLEKLDFFEGVFSRFFGLK